MAEVVQANLDSMVPGLRDLSIKGIFAESEIHAIVNRRRQQEYLLRRRTARKSDYLRYIQAELSLERLRTLRTRRKISQLRKEQHRETSRTDKPATKKAKNLQNFSIIGHVHSLFQKTIVKWPDDLELTLQHAAFAREVRSTKILGRIYASALQIHPRRVGLWIEAANFEFFGYGNDESQFYDNEGVSGSVENARILFQRGLRLNPSSSELWVQYFAMEWHYCMKLRVRKEIGLEEGGSVEGGVLPRVIFKNAIKAIPDDVTFRCQFLNVLEGFTGTEDMRRDILKTIEGDFGHVEEAWIKRAKYAWDYNWNSDDDDDSKDDQTGSKRKRENGAQTDKEYRRVTSTLDIINEATERLNSPDMYTQSAHLMIDLSSKITSPSAVKALTTHLDTLFEKAQNESIHSPALLLSHADFLINSDRVYQAEDLLQEATSNQYPTHAQLWIQLANLKQKMTALHLLKSKHNNTPTQILLKAAATIPMHNHQHLEILISTFQHLICTPIANAPFSNKDGLDLFSKILLIAPSYFKSSSLNTNKETALLLPTICLQYLKYNTINGGIKHARHVYNAVLFQSQILACIKEHSLFTPQMEEFFHACIALEKCNHEELNTSRNGSRMKQKLRLCKIYDVAIGFYKDALKDHEDRWIAMKVEDTLGL